MNILKIAAALFCGTALYLGLNSFCGFYVAKSDVTLFNKASQVILARDGDKTIITMSNDFEGDAKDFAMVVPVPVVLQKEDVAVVDKGIFDRLEAYSGPRLVEYYDNYPCKREMYKDMEKPTATAKGASREKKESVEEERYQVKVEAKYTVGEYDILILSAKESSGLKDWLIDNGYKIPEKANEVLQPYINSNMKFFVVKVNLGEQEKTGTKDLRPLQIRFNSPKFMLPIRLGMANSTGYQDLIIYALSKGGRVETTNYRTAKIPTNRKVPDFVKNDFGNFYKSVFDRAWQKNKRGVFLEYFWDLRAGNPVKCDPCPFNPPTYADLRDAGAGWLTGADGYGNAYNGDAYITRMHVRYDRVNFPQDLVFQETADKKNFQGRYIITRPVTGAECDEAYTYYHEVYLRRQKELAQYAWLTGKAAGNADYANQFKKLRDQVGERMKKEGKTLPVLKQSSMDDGEEEEGGANHKWGGVAVVLGFVGLVLVFSKIGKA